MGRQSLMGLLFSHPSHSLPFLQLGKLNLGGALLLALGPLSYANVNG
jgi:hypothetical protein